MALGSTPSLHEILSEFDGIGGDANYLTDLFRGQGVVPAAMTSVPASGAIALSDFTSRGVFDFTSLQSASSDASIGLGFSGALCVRWGKNGTRLYVLEDENTLAQWTVPEYGTSLSGKKTLALSGTVYSFCIAPDGTEIKLLDVFNEVVQRRPLLTAWEIDSASTGSAAAFPAGVTQPYGISSFEDQSYIAYPRMVFLDHGGFLRSALHGWGLDAFFGTAYNYNAASNIGTSFSQDDDLYVLQRAYDGSPAFNGLIIVPVPGNNDVKFFQSSSASNFGSFTVNTRTPAIPTDGPVAVAHHGSHFFGIDGSNLRRFPIMINP